MLDLKYIRNNLDFVKKSMGKRNIDVDFDFLLAIDDKKKFLLSKIERLRHKRNIVSDDIAEMKKQKKSAGVSIQEMRKVSETIKKLDKELNELEKTIYDFLIVLPNVVDDDVPEGKDDTQNRVEEICGEPKEFEFKPKPHWQIAEDLNILDFKRASKLAGARFPLYLGYGAQLERALINFMLDIHIFEHGYQEVLPPFIVNKTTMTGTGQLPKFEEDLFKLSGWDYYLIPTSEVPMTNIYQGEIIDQEILPCKFTAFTPCFRSEAGSYGKDTRGLIRQHQFNKVEMVKLTLPETSFDELESMLVNAKKILDLLKLPYRVVTLCTGDLGFAAAKTYDIEVWMPSQNEKGKYREISSLSNCLDFQAKRANIRFRRENTKKPEYVHTLNGSGLAVGRTFAAILENNQQKDGSVSIPDVLVPYMKGKEKLC